MLIARAIAWKCEIYAWCCCRAISQSVPRSSKQGVPSHQRASQRLPSTPARTRFAPSPTGYLHLGSLRTALFNYLLAKATKGQFLLRIEDTDSKRTLPDAEERICRDLEWAGLQWDEGPEIGGPYGPYRQSERADLYRVHADRLLHSGHAYRCFCSVDRLDTLAKHRNQLGLPTSYDRACYRIPFEESEDRASNGESYVVRLKVPDVHPIHNDIVYGFVGQSSRKKRLHSGNPTYEDPILLKTDGLPTYHLANVVDDHFMQITHVIRAVEWMSSTPKHLILYDAFGWHPPAFAHVGLLQDNDRQKLSKRNLDLDMHTFKNNGIFPEALVNHVALLGWSHSSETDFLPLTELIKHFDLKFTKGNSIVSFSKLTHLQGLYAQKYVKEGGPIFEQMVQKIVNVLEASSEYEEYKLGAWNDLRQYVAAVLRLDAKHYESPEVFLYRNRYFFITPSVDSGRGDFKKMCQRSSVDRAVVSGTHQLFQLPPTCWTISHLKEQLSVIVSQLCNMGFENIDLEEADQSRDPKIINKILLRWLREAIMGGLPGPSMVDTMALLGRDKTMQRIESAESSLWTLKGDDP